MLLHEKLLGNLDALRHRERTRAHQLLHATRETPSARRVLTWSLPPAWPPTATDVCSAYSKNLLPTVICAMCQTTDKLMEERRDLLGRHAVLRISRARRRDRRTLK